MVSIDTIQEHRNCQCEDKPCCGCDNGVFEVEELPYPGDDTMEDYFNEGCGCCDFDFSGWPGDGSGEDDFADYNQKEADDYHGE